MIDGVVRRRGHRRDRSDPADLAVCSTRRRSGRRLRPRPPRGGPQDGRLDEQARTLALERRRQAVDTRAPQPGRRIQPGRLAAAQQVARDWTPFGLHGRPMSPCRPGAFVGDRLATGDFEAAVVDITIGLDPDLYPLLASSQTVTGGSNVVGLPGSDARRAARRRPARRARRRPGRRPTRRSRCSSRAVATCSRSPSPDEVVVVRDTLDGPVVQQVADPSDRFWDVLTWRLADDR